jgi:hypothetical protein
MRSQDLDRIARQRHLDGLSASALRRAFARFRALSESKVGSSTE